MDFSSFFTPPEQQMLQHDMQNDRHSQDSHNLNTISVDMQLRNRRHPNQDTVPTNRHSMDPPPEYYDILRALPSRNPGLEPGGNIRAHREGQKRRTRRHKKKGEKGKRKKKGKKRKHRRHRYHVDGPYPPGTMLPGMPMPTYEPYGPEPEDDPEEVAEELLENEDFQEKTQEEQIEEIRQMHRPLQERKVILQTFREGQQEQEQDEQKDVTVTGLVKKIKNFSSSRVADSKRKIKDFRFTISIFRGSIKKIESTLGTGVVSYFLFLKWLLFMNMFMGFLVFILIILPQLLSKENSSSATWLKNSAHIQNHSAVQSYGNDEFTGVELLTGTGYFNNTILYYGFYLSGIIGGGSSPSYNMTHAYIFVFGVYFLFTAMVLLFSSAGSYRNNFIGARGSSNVFQYGQKVLSGWDFNITKKPAVLRKQRSNFIEIKEQITNIKKKKGGCSRACGDIVSRLLVNFLVLGMTAGAGYGVYYLSKTQSLREVTDIGFVNEIVTALAITFANYFLPIVFSALTLNIDKFNHPSTEIYIIMARTLFLNIVTVGCLLVFWFTEIPCEGTSRISAIKSELECRLCWEDFIGQEIYKFVIVDLGFKIVFSIITEVVPGLCSKMCCGRCDPEFNIALNSLNLIYSQTLVWVGAVFCPWLILMTAVKLFILFFFKRVTVLTFCGVSLKPWRAAQTHTVMLGFLFIAFILSFISVGYSMAFIKPAEVCGPFQYYNSSLEVATLLVEDLQQSSNWFENIIGFVTTNEFLITVLFGMVVAAYYARTRAKALAKIIKILQREIDDDKNIRNYWALKLQQAGYKPQNRRPHGTETGGGMGRNLSHQIPANGYQPQVITTNKG